MACFKLVTFITVVSLLGLIVASPSRDLSISLDDQISHADALGLVHVPAEGPWRRASRDDHLEIKATDLLRSVITIVESYTDDDFEDLLKAIQDKIEKIDNPDTNVVEFQKLVLKKLKGMQGEEGVLRGDLHEMLARLEDARYHDRAVKLDSAEKRAAALKILTTLNDLDAYRFKSKRVDIALPGVVCNGLEALAALLAAQAPVTRTPRTPAPPQGPEPPLGELVLLSLLSLPTLSKLRLQLVKEKEVVEPNDGT